jgi:hypothetical protein
LELRYGKYIITLNKPPISSGASIVKVAADSVPNVAYALDSTHTAWVYSNATSNDWVWSKVTGTVYDIDAGGALGTGNSDGNVYTIYDDGTPNNPAFALLQFTKAPTLVSLLKSPGTAGIDSAGAVWQATGNSLVLPWTKLPSQPFLAATAVVFSNDIWVADNSNHLVRYYPNSTLALKQEVPNPAEYIMMPEVVLSRIC